METDARLSFDGFFGGCIYERVEGVYLTGDSAHHLLLKAAVAVTAKAV